MITIHNLSMAFGGRVLYTDVSLNLNPGKKYGLLGANGTGKSTFMKILAGIEEPSEGTLTTPKSTRIGWMRQDQFMNDEDRIIDVVIQGNQKLWQAMTTKESLIEANEWSDEAVAKMGDLEDIIAEENGYEAESFAEVLLEGLGIPLVKQRQQLKTLSGGFKLRVLLAQTLFNNPDILLLDEPTNHLDIMTIGWLEDYLRTQYKGTLVTISHDHDFLSRLCTHILDIDYGEIREYVGNYDRFVAQKKLIEEQKLQQLQHMEAHIAQMRKFIERFRASATRSKQALSREKHVEKLELPDIKQSSRRAPAFNFKQAHKTGKDVLSVKNISKSFGELQVLHNISFGVGRGDKIALVGPNGIGKSTLLKIIMDALSADEGTTKWGYEVKTSYFAQDHHDLLKGRMTSVDHLMETAPAKPDAAYYGALGAMLFTQDLMKSNIQVLSGGEAARLLFARITMEEPNFMVLDEPTNHLDLESREALANSLRKYPGTLVCVSHDRHFVSTFANRIIAMTPDGITDYKGTYQEFLDKFGQDYLSQAWLKVNA